MNQLAVRELWLDGWRGPSILEIDGERVSYVGPAAGEVLPISVFPGFVDSHVHLGLVEPSELASNGIAGVVDLGWVPEHATQWLSHEDAGWPTVEIAGALLAPVGGYPSASGWAPAGATVEIASLEDARGAVDAQAVLGASLIKITLNSVAGPVFDDELLTAIIGHVHDTGLRAVVHAEGVGEAERAFRAGADLLAHSPFTEPLSQTLLAEMAGRCSWISTLDIHGWGRPTPEFAIAVDNVARFHALGGTVTYGTDLGNGPLPVGVNERELRALEAAGLDEHALIGAIVGPLGTRLSVIDTPRTTDLSAWLSSATVRTADDLLKGHP